MNFQLTAKRIEVFSELFTNLVAGFFGSLVIFPGIFGIKNISDLLPLLIINLPSGILALLVALRLKEYANEQ